MKLWIAQGFGLGRIPFAQGTFGSLLGLGWFALLLCGRSWLLFAAGAAFGIAVSIWLCSEGEKQLHHRDPGPVVLDEITAMPLCFVAAMVLAGSEQPQWPGPEHFFSRAGGLQTAAIFLLFRLFDIWKPWPVRQSQSLSGGLGITIDDVLAAVYVNLVVWAASPFVRF
ncbi:MAG: phosphatidylglycerophosphatase A [Verrucomicrobiota bacterium]|jgi:phosphatidylglycerophosphatase A